MSETLLRLPAVMDRTGFKRSKIYDLVSKGRFPRPTKIEGCTVWPKSKIDHWITQRLAESEVVAD